MGTHVYSKLIIFILIATSSIQILSQEKSLLRDSLPQKWAYISEFSQTLPSDDKWWTNFEDKCLDSLINIAINNNYDLLIAQKRIALAKSAIKLAQSGYYPNLSMNVGWTKERNEDYFDLGLNFSWQIDLFGQITSQAKAKKALWQASKSQYDGAMVTLCSNVATAYFNLRTWQTQYMVALWHIQSQKEILNLVENRFKSGLASMFDVSQSKTLFLSTQASIASLKANIDAQINSIAILLGVYRDKLPQSIYNAIKLPNLNTLIPVGVPMDLLRRRPDIKEAEYNLAAYAAEIGIAQKDFLPTLSLNGGIGFKSSKIGDLFKDDSFNYTISPTINWTIFDGFSRKYQLIEAKEQYQISIDNYNSTVMNAVKEVQNSMITYKYKLIETQEAAKVKEESYRSLEYALDLYKKGLTAYSDVLTAQQTYLEYNNSLVVSQGDVLLAAISIYQALGGGWNNLDY